MSPAYSKNLDRPDDSFVFPRLRGEIIDLGDVTVGRTVSEPGWRWSTDVRPIVGGEWCQARHVGLVLAGRFGVVLRDGTTYEFGRDDAYEIPPGHDGYTIGDEDCVMIEWSGVRAFAGFRLGTHGRALVTLLFADLVDSTTFVSRLGDIAWREIASSYFEAARAELERFDGREVKTTGDGLLATFAGPAQALGCADAIRRAAGRQQLTMRAGVHVGEVELVGTDVRGAAVHEAARVMEHADADEILVSEITRTLVLASGLAFDDRGPRSLKGLPGERRLFAYVPAANAPH